LAVLGGDPRSTVGGGSAAVLDDASGGTEMTSASTAMGRINPKMKASAPITRRLGWRASSLVKIGMVRGGTAI